MLIVIVLGIFVFSGKFTGNSVSAQGVDLYKSPGCGCCVGHAGFLERNGFHVNSISTLDFESIKIQYNIPKEMWSCHTTMIENYFVEGHVPMEAIEKLLEEQPDIDGIALPNMPSGSPGMPGKKNSVWIIYSVRDGNISEFMRI